MRETDTLERNLKMKIILGTSACSVRDISSHRSLGWEDPLEKGMTTLQYSGLENSMDYIVHGVAKSQTQLSAFHWWSNS